MKNPYYMTNEWGWQIDAEGLRYSLVDFYSRYHKPLFIVGKMVLELMSI